MRLVASERITLSTSEAGMARADRTAHHEPPERRACGHELGDNTGVIAAADRVAEHAETPDHRGDAATLDAAVEVTHEVRIFAQREPGVGFRARIHHVSLSRDPHDARSGVSGAISGASIATAIELRTPSDAEVPDLLHEKIRAAFRRSTPSR